MNPSAMLEALYTSYVNLARKHGLEPVSRAMFITRMKIWEW